MFLLFANSNPPTAGFFFGLLPLKKNSKKSFFYEREPSNRKKMEYITYTLLKKHFKNPVHQQKKGASQKRDA